MKLNLPIEIEQIEEITQLKMKEIIFDSECCDCFENTFLNSAKQFFLYQNVSL